jgi:hypothetical protein
MDAVPCYETPVNIYQITRRYILEVNNTLYTVLSEILNSVIQGDSLYSASDIRSHLLTLNLCSFDYFFPPDLSCLAAGYAKYSGNDAHLHSASQAR